VNSPAGSREAALWLLAERLYYFLEKYDPSENSVLWGDLSDWQKEYYYRCIFDVLSERDAVLRAIK